VRYAPILYSAAVGFFLAYYGYARLAVSGQGELMIEASDER